MQNFKQNIHFILFVFLLFISALQFSSFGIVGDIYNYLRVLILGGVILLFIVSFKNPIKIINKILLVKVHTFFLFLFSFFLFFFYAFGVDVSFSPSRDLLISLIALLIGFNLDLSKKLFIRLGTVYIVFYTLSALSIVFTFSSGFIIQDQYLPVPKNQLAPVFGVAFILGVYFAIKQKGLGKVLYLILSTLLLTSLLVIRGRAVIVAVFFTLFIFIFFYVDTKKYKFLIIAIILILIPFLGQFVYDAMFLNYDITDMDSIATGRVDRNIMGLEFFFKYPITGELTNTFTGARIHNYVLISLVSYGILLSSLILFVYFQYIIKITKAVRDNTLQYFEVGPLVLIILFVVSLFEYTYPYAPGSAIFYPFFLMGYYLKEKEKTTTNKFLFT